VSDGNEARPGDEASKRRGRLLGYLLMAIGAVVWAGGLLFVAQGRTTLGVVMMFAGGGSALIGVWLRSGVSPDLGEAISEVIGSLLGR
jgi:hypothetical protein